MHPRRQRKSDAPEDLLSVYLSSIRGKRASTPPQGAQAVPAGSQAWKQALVVDHLAYAVKLAMQYAGKGIPLLDLIQAANYGLVYAASRYREERGVPFSHYAGKQIKWKILHLFEREAYQCRRQLNGEDRPVLYEDRLEKEDEAAYVQRLVGFLPDNERFVLTSWYGIGTEKLNLRDIARINGYSPQRAGTVLRRAEETLRKLMSPGGARSVPPEGELVTRRQARHTRFCQDDEPAAR